MLLYAQIGELNEQLSQFNDWFDDTEGQVRRDSHNKMDINRESYGYLECSQHQMVQDAREAFGLLLEQLDAVIHGNTTLGRVPSDIDAFTAWTLQCVRDRRAARQ
jgi:hypothetical protein